MTIAHAYQIILEKLTGSLGGREAQNVAKYFIEDVYGTRDQLSSKELDSKQVSAFNSDLIALESGMPLQYVTGKAWFYDLEFNVNKNVLIPRPETEELVDRMIKDYKNISSPTHILEIGTGSACIAISLAINLPMIQLIATDISHEALECAQRNAHLHQVEIEFRKHNWLEESDVFLGQKIDCIVSNPPYIDLNEKNEMGESVLQHEPHLALFAEENGLAFYKEISAFVEKNPVKPDLYLELNEFKSAEILKLFVDLYAKVKIVQDLQGKDRILIASAD